MSKECGLDFETEEILPRPAYPPKPVGCAVTYPDGKSKYWAWGHPTQNNCTKSEFHRELKRIYREYVIVCHNGKFDLEVAEVFFNMPLEPKNGWHDSMLLAFLYNPRTWSLKLKDLADEHLSMPPVEQDKLHQWVIDNVEGGKQSKSKWGKYISLTPATLCGKYAKGDTIRTVKLFRLFYKYVKEMGMLEQYEVEKRVVFKAIKMEREGIAVDYKLLAPELEKAEKERKKHERAMFKIVGDINFNSAPQIVKAFNKKKLVKKWEYTDKGNERTGIDSLLRVCKDKKLVHHLDYFSKYNKIIGTYMRPWLNSALENNGVFYPWFNTIKGDDDKGTYTGRFSSNFQQVPRKPLEDYKTLPFLRNFIIPDKPNQILLNRDFMSQEMRILAHFEDGSFLAAYLENPLLDGHDFVKEAMLQTSGIAYARVHVKGCNFLIVYGGGAPALSSNLKLSLAEAKDIFAAHSNALPDVKELKDDLKALSIKGEMFKTAGGRWYEFEYGKEYVALNTLIQGSAADHSKRALLNIDDMLEAEGHEARMILTVHDEFMLSASKRNKKRIMADFKEAMELDKLFDLPMLTDGKMGLRWGTMEKVK